MKAGYLTISVALLTALAVGQDTATRSVWEGVYTAQQASRGEGSYKSECASCHGSHLEGGEIAPPLAGPEFLANWSGQTVNDLYERVRTTMPLSSPGKLSLEVNADMIAYILAVNKFPAGGRDLPHESEALKHIRLVAEKPGK